MQSQQILLRSHFKLSKKWSPNINEEQEYMPKVLYAFVVGILMYDMLEKSL